MLALLAHAAESAAAECADHGPVTSYPGPCGRIAERDSIFCAGAGLADLERLLPRQRAQWH